MKLNNKIIILTGILSLFLATITGNVLADHEKSIQLRIEGNTTTYFDGQVAVSECEVIDTTGNKHKLDKVAACAVTQVLDSKKIPYSLEDFGFGLFLKSIGNDETPVDYSHSWSFWVNNEPASIGIDSYQLQSDDNILLAFSSNPTIPLLLTGPDQVFLNSAAVFTVEKIIGEYDENFIWHGATVPAPAAFMLVNETPQSVTSDGSWYPNFTDSGEYILQAFAPGMVRSTQKKVQVIIPSPTPKASPTIVASNTPSNPPSPVSTITPTLTPSTIPIPTPSPLLTPTSTTIPTPTPSPTPSNSSTPSSSPSPSPTPSPSPVILPLNDNDLERAAHKALTFLKSKQKADGAVDGPVVTAWTILAFGADNKRASNIKAGNNSLWSALNQANLNTATDLERQILAIRASGNDAHAWLGRNLVQELRTHFNNNQFGIPNQVNDDIFGLLALLATDEQINDNMVKKTVSNILQHQEPNGSWQNFDLTAAAIQALKAYQNKSGEIDVNTVIEKARTFLRINQDKYGGWGENSASTAWVIQAIVSLGEDVSTWTNDNQKSPWHALLRYQNENGSFGWKSDSDTSSFMTAYAVPALLKIAWPITRIPLPNPTPQLPQPIPTTPATYETTQQTAPPFPTPNIPAFTADSSPPLPDFAPSVPVITSPEVIDSTEIISTLSPPAEIKNIAKGNVAGTQINRNKPSSIPDNSNFLFSFAVFGLANMGIGVTLTRLFLKII